MATHGQLSLPHSAFNQQAFEDPYLSGPSDLDEEFSLEQHTPSVSSVGHPSRVSSRSPAEDKLSSDPQNPSYEFRQDSFDESKFINFDQLASPEPLFSSDILLKPDGQIDANLPTTEERNYPEEGNREAHVTGQRQPTGISQTHQPARLEIPDSAYNNGNSPADTSTKSIPSISPVVKVSQFHHGDSPTREDGKWSGYGSKRSSVHLSPVDDIGGVDQAHDATDTDQGYSPSRAEDGSWIPDTTTGQAGLDPYARNNEFVPSPKDMEEERLRAEKDVDIQIWSASVSQATSEMGDVSSPWEQLHGRRRAVSDVEPRRQDYFGLTQPNDSHIPGPGLPIYERDPGSDFELSSEDSQSESVDGLPPLEFTIQDEPLARQLNRAYPWKDPPQFPFPLAIKTQPESSRAAMKLYEDLTKSMETASRVGTWGSKRLNDADVESLFKSDGFFKHFSLNKASFLKYLPKRSNSASKDKRRYFHRLSRQSSFEAEQNDKPPKKESITSKLSHRSSLNRPKTPSSVMVAAIAGQMAASIVGKATSSVSPGDSLSATTPWGRSRSKSEGNGAMPDLKPLTISNLEQKQSSSANPSSQVDSALTGGAECEDDEDDESGDEKDGVFMNLAPSPQRIVPTYDGFKRQIGFLNPRLEPALLDRFAREQLRRYKKLVDEHKRHADLVRKGNCNPRERCFASGGCAKLLPPRANAKDPKANYCQFQIPGHENSGDEDDYDEGIDKTVHNSVVPAVFAQGIRLPPVKKLPAEFECTLCFKVKGFQKPSDWTKHIYEDILPFTCTFPNCNEPKSFKRKADWVRHEGECHRHLEWWVCNMPQCGHVCFRKNNFVQHLVREHGRPDPKAKRVKSSAGSGNANSASNAKEIAKLWSQVDECRHETKERPESEPCRFCGNISNDWRKLMVHLARHLEQIALPLLHLVEEHCSSTNEALDIYQTTAPEAPSISVYNSADSQAADSTQIPGIEEPKVMDGSEIQPMMPYHAQQESHMLSPSINLEATPSGTTYPPASNPSYLQPHYTPAHRNSMSYPPTASPHLMATRQATAMSNFGPISDANAFQLNISTSSLGFDGSQQQLYQSPQDTCMGPDSFLPAAYEGTPMANYSITASPEAEYDQSITQPYLMQMQDHTYPPATYNFQ